MDIKSIFKKRQFNWLIFALIIAGCAASTPHKTFEERTVGLYLQGNELYKKGEYVQAIYLLKQAVDFNKDFARLTMP